MRYYILLEGGEEQGPYTIDELMSYLEQGVLQSNSSVRREFEKDWITLEEAFKTSSNHNDVKDRDDQPELKVKSDKTNHFIIELALFSFTRWITIISSVFVIALIGLLFFDKILTKLVREVSVNEEEYASAGLGVARVISESFIQDAIFFSVITVLIIFLCFLSLILVLMGIERNTRHLRK